MGLPSGWLALCPGMALLNFAHALLAKVIPFIILLPRFTVMTFIRFR